MPKRTNLKQRIEETIEEILKKISNSDERNIDTYDWVHSDNGNLEEAIWLYREYHGIGMLDQVLLRYPQKEKRSGKKQKSPSLLAAFERDYWLGLAEEGKVQEDAIKVVQEMELGIEEIEIAPDSLCITNDAKFLLTHQVDFEENKIRALLPHNHKDESSGFDERVSNGSVPDPVSLITLVLEDGVALDKDGRQSLQGVYVVRTFWTGSILI